MPQTIDPSMLSVSGLSGTPAYMPQEDDLYGATRKKKAQKGITGSIAQMPTDNMSGINLPEEYGDRAVKEENTIPEGYDPKVSNVAQQSNGEMTTSGQNSGTPIRYEAGNDPMIQAMNAKLAELAHTYGDIQGKIQEYHPSKVRTALSIAAGIGTGMLTANPMAGMKFGQQLQYEPRNRQLEPLEAKAHQQEAELKSMQDISGLGAKLGENQAAYVRAQGTYMRGEAAEKAEEYKTTHPEMTTEKVTGPGGEDTLVQTPKTGGPGKEVYKGGVKPGEHAGKFEKVVKADGTVVIVDKTTNKATPVTGPDGQPIKEKTQEEQGFDAYWKSLPDDQKTPENALKWPKAGAATIAGERAGESEKKDTKETFAGQHAAGIGQSVDKLGLKDSDAAFAAAMRKLDAAAAQDPKIAAVKGEIQKQLRAKYPKKAAGGNKFDPSAILNAAKPNQPR